MALTTAQIEEVLFSDPDTKYNFYGVIPFDWLPRNLVNRKPFSLIMNLDEHYRSGSHWVALYVPVNGPAEYFDSYGRPPTRSSISTYLDRNSKSGWLYNGHKYQGDLSNVCGFYAMFYILARAKGLSKNQIHKLFLPKVGEINDRLIKHYFEKIQTSLEDGFNDDDD